MARKPTAGGKTRKNASKSRAESEQPEVVETTLLMPDSDVVLSLAKAKLKLQKSNATSGGELGEKIGKAVESKHLDRKAFSIACQFNKMMDHDKEKMAITYFHLIHYLNDLNVPNTAKDNAGMFSAEETGPGLKGKDDGEGKDGDAGNVTHIGAAARRVAAAAGEQA